VLESNDIARKGRSAEVIGSLLAAVRDLSRNFRIIGAGTPGGSVLTRISKEKVSCRLLTQCPALVDGLGAATTATVIRSLVLESKSQSGPLVRPAR